MSEQQPDGPRRGERREEPGAHEVPGPGPRPGSQPTGVRRAPRYRVFLLTGFLLGAVAAVLVTLGSGDPGDYSTGSVFGYVLAVLGGVGALVGGLVAVLLDRGRRARR